MPSNTMRFFLYHFAWFGHFFFVLLAFYSFIFISVFVLCGKFLYMLLIFLFYFVFVCFQSMKNTKLGREDWERVNYIHDENIL